MALNDILEVRFVMTAGQQVALNVRHFRINTVVGVEATRAEIATEISDDYAALYKAQISSAATFRGVGVRRVAPGPRTEESVDIGLAGAGTRGPDLLPKQSSAVISLRTAEATRRGRGRVFVPFPSETDNDSAGAPVAAYNTSLAGLASQFDNVVTVVTGLGTTTLIPGIFRRSDGTFRQITSVVARTVWGTQRRRGDMGRTNISPF